MQIDTLIPAFSAPHDEKAERTVFSEGTLLGRNWILHLGAIDREPEGLAG
jgi:hypothetical protein